MLTPYQDELGPSEAETMLEAEARLRTALSWIATVNESIDLKKLDTTTLIGLIYELRGKAKEALKCQTSGHDMTSRVCDRTRTYPTIPVTVSEFDGDQTIRYKAGDVVESDDPRDVPRPLPRIVHVDLPEAPVDRLYYSGSGKCLECKKEWKACGCIERRAKCLRGEHEAEVDYGRVMELPVTGKPVRFCRHCRCLFVER